MPLSTQPPPEELNAPPPASPEGDFDNTPATADKDAPKPAESGTPGTKSTLTPAKDAIPTARIAQQEGMEPGDPNADPGNPQDQIYSSQILPERDKDQLWQDRAVEAINGLYPRLRNGVDFAVGRKSLMSDVELLHNEGDVIDWGKVEEAARKLVGDNPYADYKAKPGLAPPQSKGFESGEVPYRGNLEQSETPSVVNPQATEGEKIPTQPHGAEEPRSFDSP